MYDMSHLIWLKQVVSNKFFPKTFSNENLFTAIIVNELILI